MRVTALLTGITNGMYPSMKAKMDTLEAERARLEAALFASHEPQPVALHPGLAALYAGKVSDVAEALTQDGITLLLTRGDIVAVQRGFGQNMPKPARVVRAFGK